MLILALNTAFAAMNGAIVRDGQCLIEQTVPLPRGQEQALPGFVAGLLADVGIGFEELDRLAVVTGPGSFTGIRIGVSYMRGLALALDIPCLGLTSLEAGIDDAIAGDVLCGLQAQRRPPDQTWWMQHLRSGLGVSETIEVSHQAFKDAVILHSGLVSLNVPDAIGALEGTKTIEVLTPSAQILGLKAARLEPEEFPPSPVYARAPDAALPASGKK